MPSSLPKPASSLVGCWQVIVRKRYVVCCPPRVGSLLPAPSGQPSSLLQTGLTAFRTKASISAGGWWLSAAKPQLCCGTLCNWGTASLCPSHPPRLVR